MKNLAVARRYAKALLLIGKEDGNAEAYRDEIAKVVGLLKENPQLAQAVSNPLYETAGRRSLWGEILKRLDLSQVMRSFLMLLFDKKRVRYLEDICNAYQRMADELKGVIRAELVSATPLSEEVVEKIRTTLSLKTGKDIILNLEQDPGLIGGIVTKIGDLVIDGSIKTQLLNMRETLKRGESV